MNKIVINKSYGGFSLSPKAIKRYYELTEPEKELFVYSRSYNCGFKKDETFSIYGGIVLSKDYGNDYFIEINEEDIVRCNPKRTDPILIQVVEELGKEADNWEANLRIEEFEGDLYRIVDYDGFETLETPDTIQWEHLNLDLLEKK